MDPKTSVRILQSKEKRTFKRLLSHSLARNGGKRGAKGIQGQSLLAFWELGWGGGACCSLGELLEISFLFVRYFLSANCHGLKNSGMTSLVGRKMCLCQYSTAAE